MSEIPARLSSALSRSYRVERELGQGGMATVYLAEDLKHHRQVAVKVLRPELAATLGPQRARLAYEQQLQATPQNASRHVLLGQVLAYLNRKSEAIAEGQRGVALLPISKDAIAGAHNQHHLAWIYTLVGEPEKALDQLDPLLTLPYYLSPGWLRVDPTFAPLRGNPRFERLVEGH